jgi:hypothetical protein
MQVGVMLSSQMGGSVQLLREQDQHLLLSWVALVMLTAKELGCSVAQAGEQAGGTEKLLEEAAGSLDSKQ